MTCGVSNLEFDIFNQLKFQIDEALYWSFKNRSLVNLNLLC